MPGSNSNGNAPPGAAVTEVFPASTQVLRMRGLPYTATEAEIKGFFSSYELDEVDPIVVITQGFHRGEGYARFRTPAAAADAYNSLNRKEIGDRYIELYPSTDTVMNSARQQQALMNNTTNSIIRLRGLPFTVGENEIRSFFASIADKIVNVQLCLNVEGRPTGDAFVELTSTSAAMEAMGKNKETMGARYIEIFESTPHERDILITTSRRGRGRNGRPIVSNNITKGAGGGRGGGAMGKGGADAEAQARYMQQQLFMMQQMMLMNAMGPNMMTPQVGGRGKNGGAGYGNPMMMGGGGGGGGVGFGAFSPFGPMGGGGGAGPAMGVPPMFGGGMGNPMLGPMMAGGGGMMNPMLGPMMMQPDLMMGAAGGMMLPPRPPSQFVVRVRGLPFSANEGMVAEFFHDVNIPPQGVHMVYNAQERPTGEAFVEVVSEADVLTALSHSGEALGHRYIEVFRSSEADMSRLGGAPMDMIAPMIPPMMAPPMPVSVPPPPPATAYSSAQAAVGFSPPGAINPYAAAIPQPTPTVTVGVPPSQAYSSPAFAAPTFPSKVTVGGTPIPPKPDA